MGATSWFLGCRYDWHYDEDGKLSCHISQQAFVEGLLQKFNLEHITPAKTPYRSGIKIGRVKHDGKDPSTKMN